MLNYKKFRPTCPPQAGLNYLITGILQQHIKPLFIYAILVIIKIEISYWGTMRNKL